MELTDERRAKTGAFYTPKIWADKAVEYIRAIIPDMENYFFWDMAAGEGALLEALPENCEKYATTLEYDDVNILRDNGFTANRFDFLNDDISRLLDIKATPKNKLIVFTNPPYVKLPADNPCAAQVKYKTNDATALFFYRILYEVQPLLLCSFNKTDLLQAPIHKDFRQRIPLDKLIVSMFYSPSKSWGLKGDFPIAFNILCNVI